MTGTKAVTETSNANTNRRGIIIAQKVESVFPSLAVCDIGWSRKKL